MTETGQDFTRYRGEDWVIDVTIAGSGSIAGWTFAATWRRSDRDLDSDGAVLELTSDDGIEITDPDARTIRIRATDEQSLLFDDGVPAREYPWDLKRTNDGSEGILLIGTATVRNPVTR